MALFQPESLKSQFIETPAVVSEVEFHIILAVVVSISVCKNCKHSS